MITVIALGLLIFLGITHILNWWNDFIGYRASAIVNIVSNEREKVEGEIGIRKSDPIKTYEQLVTKYQNTIKAANLAQWVSLWIQHLVAPLVACFLALALLWLF